MAKPADVGLCQRIERVVRREGEVPYGGTRQSLDVLAQAPELAGVSSRKLHCGVRENIRLKRFIRTGEHTIRCR